MKNIINIERAEELKEIILTCGKLHIATLILGRIGIGKSQIVKQLHKEYGGEFEDIRISTMDRTDIRGLFSIENDTTKWNIPQRLNKFFKPGARGILFFDEINLADIDIQSALYQIILDRELEGLKLGDEVIIVCAGNTPDEVPMVKPMSPALRSRFAICYYNPKEKDILNYLESKYKNKSKICDSILDYYNLFKGDIMESIKSEDVEEYDMFARPRNIENILRYAESIDVNNYMSERKSIYNMFATLAGTATANKLIDFLNKIYTNEHEKYKIEKYLSGEMSVKNLSEGEKYIVLMAAVEYVFEKYRDMKGNISKTSDIIDEIYDKILRDMYKDYQTMFGIKLVGKFKDKKEEAAKILMKSKLMKIYTDFISESSKL